jgi:hypothetical protein
MATQIILHLIDGYDARHEISEDEQGNQRIEFWLERPERLDDSVKSARVRGSHLRLIPRS